MSILSSYVEDFLNARAILGGKSCAKKVKDFLCWRAVGNEERKFNFKKITTVKGVKKTFWIFIYHIHVEEIHIEFTRSELPCFTNHISSLVSSQRDHNTIFLSSPGHPPFVWMHFPVFKCFSECPGKHQSVRYQLW